MSHARPDIKRVPVCGICREPMSSTQPGRHVCGCGKSAVVIRLGKLASRHWEGMTITKGVLVRDAEEDRKPVWNLEGLNA